MSNNTNTAIRKKAVRFLLAATIVVLLFQAGSCMHAAMMNPIPIEGPSNNFATVVEGTNESEAPPAVAAAAIPKNAHTTSSGGDKCRVQLSRRCQTPSGDAAKPAFEHVYSTGFWIGGSNGSSLSRSGVGSSIAGAFDTIVKLQDILQKLDVKSVADTPCGDVFWQMSMSRLNLATAYFGGDITDYVTKTNQRNFAPHTNKVFDHMNIVECDMPMWHTTCDPTPRPFEFIIMRDVIQHLKIQRGMQAIKRQVLNSGATYVAVTTWGETPGCKTNKSEQCQHGNIADSSYYSNRLPCAPWKLPQPLFHFPSHSTFLQSEKDEMYIYRTEDLKPYVLQFDDCENMSIGKKLQQPARETTIAQTTPVTFVSQTPSQLIMNATNFSATTPLCTSNCPLDNVSFIVSQNTTINSNVKYLASGSYKEFDVEIIVGDSLKRAVQGDTDSVVQVTLVKDPLTSIAFCDSSPLFSRVKNGIAKFHLMFVGSTAINGNELNQSLASLTFWCPADRPAALLQPGELAANPCTLSNMSTMKILVKDSRVPQEIFSKARSRCQREGERRQ